MKAIAIIPARYSSTRLQGKVLADIGGMTLLERVHKKACAAQGLERVIVATDDERVAQEARRFGAQVEMTSPEHASGTDRVAEVAARLELPESTAVVNIQADAPFLPATMVEAVARAVEYDQAGGMSALYCPITDEKELSNPGIVKVVVDSRGLALYFSRAAIPYVRNESHGAEKPAHFKHIGPYAFRKDFLMRLTKLPVGTLEKIEGLEQLRALENGFPIRMVATDEECFEVDTQDDLDRARKIAARSG